jgi:hypothetical protein
MRIVEALGAQGEVRMFRVDEVPAHAAPVDDRVIGHSETGHHHVLVAEKARVYEDRNAPRGMRVLYAILESAGSLEHLRPHDTHAPHFFEPGDVIMFRTDREYDPYNETARRIVD